MKKKLTLLMMGATFIASSQNFTTHEDVSASLGRVMKTINHDFDGDGDLDVVFGSVRNGKIGWYENLGGGNFSSQKIIASGVGVEPFSTYPDIDFTILDVNSDNNPDVIFFYPNNLVWYENLGGGNFSSSNLIDSNDISYTARFASPADIDGDGVKDIVLASKQQILWYKNLGGGVFSSSILVADSLTYLKKLQCADLDGDGKVDLFNVHNLQNNNDFKIYWLKNLGGGSFAPATFISRVSGPGGINARDVDNDGDLDIVTCSNISNDTTVFWLQNNGSGVFSNKKLIFSDFISLGIGFQKFHVSDLNSDGNIDIVIYGSGRKLYWCENLGNSTFAPYSYFAELPYSGDEGYNYLDFSIDVNQDGINDILTSSRSYVNPPYKGEGEVFWLEGLGSVSYDTIKNLISSNLEIPKSVFSADIDGDGLKDILSASFGDGKVVWFKNLGNNKFGLQNKILSREDSAFVVRVADIDNDGDQDVISGYSNDSVFLSVNNGAGIFGMPTHLSTIAYSPKDINLVDINGDNNIDILLASQSSGKVVWYENLGGNSFSAENVISSSMGGAAGVYGADFDLDGNVDVAAVAPYDDKIVWFKNMGSGSFSSENVISMLSNNPLAIHCADISGDGVVDIVVGSPADNKVAWFENFGNGSFSAQNVLPTNIFGVSSVFAADIDNDGDNDIVVSARFGGRVLWYENLGGSFSLENVISAATLDVASIFVTDIDNDGDNDVLSASEDVDLIALHENNICNSNSLTAYFYKYQDAVTNDIFLVDSSQGNDLIYHWDFGDGNSSTLVNLTHTYATRGVYNVCLTITDTVTNCSDYFCDSLDVDSNGVLRSSFNVNVVTHGANTTDIIEAKKELSSLVYPNPTNNNFINISTIDDGNKIISVFDVYGKLIQSKTISNTLSKCNLPNEKGVYFIRIQYEDGNVTTHKIIKN